MMTIENLIGEDDSCDVDDGGDGGDDDGDDGCDGDDGGDGYVMVVLVVMFVKLNCLRRQMSIVCMCNGRDPNTLQSITIAQQNTLSSWNSFEIYVMWKTLNQFCLLCT